MSYVVGPVGVLGHPFCVTHEVPVRREIGGNVVYAFDNKWLYTDLELVPEDRVKAVVVWDPSWRRSGQPEKGSINEMRRLWELARSWDAPLVGLYSDWFAAWHSRWDLVGTEKSVPYLDALVTDPVGAAAMRAAVPLLRVGDPKDTRHRPVVTMDNFLTYGRMPTLGGDSTLVETVLVDHPQEERHIDVSFIGHAHPGAVLFRSYHLEALRAECELMGYSLHVTHRASAEEMEQTLLDTKVCFNSGLGSQLNCRVYEACAAGCMLLTDNHNVANWNLFGAGTRFSTLNSMRWDLRRLLSAPPDVTLARATMNVSFALTHTPEAVWSTVLQHVDKAVALSAQTLPLRVAAERAVTAT